MDTAFSKADTMIVLPEIILACGAMAFLMLGAFRRDDMTAVITWLCVALLIVAGGFVLLDGGVRQTAFDGMFIPMPSPSS